MESNALFTAVMLGLLGTGLLQSDCDYCYELGGTCIHCKADYVCSRYPELFYLVADYTSLEQQSVFSICEQIYDDVYFAQWAIDMKKECENNLALYFIKTACPLLNEERHH